MAGNGVLIHDSADKLPPAPATPPHALISYAPGERRPARHQLPPQVFIIALCAALLPVLAGLVAFWQFVAARPWLGEALGYLAAAVVALALVALVGGVWDWLRTRRARLEAEAAQAAIARSRLGNPFDARQVGRLDVMALEALAAQFELQRAPYTIHPMLSTMSTSNAPSPPALPAPEPGLALVPDAEWRQWLAEAPHLLISGPSGAGKTTLATALLGDASDARTHLLVIDPHDAAGKWGVQAIGGGRDYDGIYAALGALVEEMNRRFIAMQGGEAVFQPWVVLVDEAPAIALHDPKRWQLLVSRLTSEARKIGIRFVLLGQSHLVRDLGLSSLVRRNLGLVALGPQALDLVNEERDAGRRRQLVELIRGQQRPAAFAYRSQVEVLDVSNVPALAERAVNPLPAALVLCSEGDEPEGAPLAERSDRSDPRSARRDALARALFAEGRSVRDVGQMVRSAGYTVDNATLIRLRGEVVK